MTIGVVLAGGELTHQTMPARLASAACADRLVIAADSGLDLARQLGIDVDLVVGDLDSVSATALDDARARGTEIREFPTDKDATDLELALEAVVASGVTSIMVLGGAGGRFDHLLGNVGVLAAVSCRHGIGVEAWLGEAYVAVVRTRWSSSVTAGATLSVLPWGGDIAVSIAGVRWPLRQHRVELGSTLGLSNEALGGDVVISVDEGVALVVLPHAEVLT